MARMNDLKKPLTERRHNYAVRCYFRSPCL